ncbi:antibiotic biosynthesis monooxygenase family protein [Mycobacterium sp.]|uniref:antibiotic biosynthesis monooxygenase family protein n=1 Tax=Mycobacterium sp. TaxID=1785 RepID=UPI003BB1EBF9
MFARVITAQAGERGFDDVIRLANQELPAARQRPGFAGYFLLTDDSTGNVIIISLWQTREDMKAVARETAVGIHDDGLSETGLSSLRLETYDVAVQA